MRKNLEVNLPLTSCVGILSLVVPKTVRLSVEEVEATHNALKEHFREKGPGSIGAAEKALGLGRTYYSSNRKRKRLDYGTLLATLKHLGVDPAEFFAEVFGEPRHEYLPDDDGGGVAARGEPEKPADPPKKSDAAPCCSEGELLDWLEQMDAARYSDPEQAAIGLWAGVEAVPEQFAAQYLAVLGSCYRMLGSLQHARECLEVALEKAAQRDALRGDILQRLAYVVFYSGDADAALALVEQAAGIYFRTDNSHRIGKALVDQAKFLVHLDRIEEAQRSLDVARRSVTESDERNCYAIENYAAVICRRSGLVAQCMEHLRRASEIAPDPLARATTLDTLGDVQRDSGNPSGAHPIYAEVVKQMEPWPLLALIATTKLVDSLAAAGRMPEAVRIALDASKYFGAVSGDRLAEAALTCLYRQACDGALTPSVVAQVKTATEKLAFSSRPDDLSAHLRRCRRCRRLSAIETAEETGVPYETYRKIEAGGKPGALHRPKLVAWLAANRPELRFA